MTELFDAHEIESVVGIRRHPSRHYARADSPSEMVYILHSSDCLAQNPDLRKCPFSVALDKGISLYEWAGFFDVAVRVLVTASGLVPDRVHP